MANWYDIEGIEFRFKGPWEDFTIVFDDVEDDSGVLVEDTMWGRFLEEGGGNTVEFGRFMVDNADEVKDLIRMARGQLV